MKVAFYDDNINTIKAFRKQHPHIKSFHIEQKKNPILKKNANFYLPLLYSQRYPNNAYAKFLVQDNDSANKPTDKNPTRLCEWTCQFSEVGSGMTLSEIKTLLSNQFDVILFDWDLTLSTCNGILLDSNANEPMNYSYLDVAQFYAGTMERFTALRAMFSELRRRGTKVYILTDNGYMKPNNIDAGMERFVQLIQQFDAQITSSDVIYGNNDKAKTVAEHPILKLFCKRNTRKKPKKITLRTAKSR
jgi:hypothetical protein